MAWGQAGARGIDDLVRRIADNDAKLTSLTILRQRRFTHDDVASLVRAMAANTNLTELYASSHPLAPHTAALLADMLAASRSLRSLCVGDSSLGDDGVAALARGIASSSSLTRLDLCNKGLGVRGAQALAGALTAAASLSHLILNSNPQLGDDGLRALCGEAADSSADGADGAASGVGGGPPPPPPPPAACWAGLRVLEVQGCGVGAAGVRALAASPGSCGRLEVVRLDGNPLGPEGGQVLTELLRAATRLRELHLRGTELQDQGGEALAAGLAPATAGASASGSASSGGVSGVDGSAAAACSPSLSSGGSSSLPLVYLDVADCGLGHRSMVALRGAFAAGARLQVLCLAENPGLADADVAALGTALAAGRLEATQAEAEATSAPLAHLDVSGTGAGPEAVAALSEAVGLRHLSLVGCPLGAAGAAALAASLSQPAGEEAAVAAEATCGRGPRRWGALRELCVSGTGLTGEGLAALFGALGAGGAPVLQSLEVGANPGNQEDSFEGLLDTLRAARPGLAVYWRSGDDPAPGER
ncbi:hypothetical protein PLESTB_000860100 [Pleodorina starrii]|uniref:Uncharacterized protein n=1 Tax=Pleodorina starrii TaxID=330485 RepID=A0A9W6F3F4_9CHLO|nr:hypothetical protein PLESTM_001433900 [Pleodorina starrii]GLC54405.1 hypothetical protein PLESTB_000860100 [Pleodorina starrii]